jgi:hypothetical protein
MFITDEKLQRALDEMKSQGFELGRVYSNPYARAFIPQTTASIELIKK